MLYSKSLFALAYMVRLKENGRQVMSGWRYMVAKRFGDRYEIHFTGGELTCVMSGDSPVSLHNCSTYTVPPRTTQGVDIRLSPDIGRVGHTFRPVEMHPSLQP